LNSRDSASSASSCIAETIPFDNSAMLRISFK
jgi:hypothetical protein